MHVYYICIIHGVLYLGGVFFSFISLPLYVESITLILGFQITKISYIIMYTPVIFILQLTIYFLIFFFFLYLFAKLLLLSSIYFFSLTSCLQTSKGSLLSYPLPNILYHIILLVLCSLFTSLNEILLLYFKVEYISYYIIIQI